MVISGVMVFIFLAMAIFPDFFAPYSPYQIVGPPLLAPGESPPTSVLIINVDSPVNNLRDLAVAAGGSRPSVAVVQGVPTAGALNEQAQKIDNEIKNQPGGMELRPRIDRYGTLKKPCRRWQMAKISPRWCNQMSSRWWLSSSQRCVRERLS